MKIVVIGGTGRIGSKCVARQRIRLATEPSHRAPCSTGSDGEIHLHD
jgi:nucleoside-diphosphate-sugar epimerase